MATIVNETQVFATPQEALLHYGVKGMKWGVTRDPESRSTYSRSERKIAGKSAMDEVYERVKNDPLFRQMTKQEYDNLSTKGEEFAAGMSFNRITTSSSTELKGAQFVSTLKEDADFYRAVLPAVGPGSDGKGYGAKTYKIPTYEATMTSLEKLKSPSERERMDAYLEILQTPSIKVSGRNLPMTGREYVEKNIPGAKPILWRKKYDNETLAMKSWYSFVKSQGDSQNPLAQAYYDNLKNKGYKVIPDDNDRQSLTKKPLILLDPASTVKVNTVNRLSADEILQAQRNLRR